MSFGVSIQTHAEDWLVSVSSSYWSKYIGSNGAIYHDNPVVQTDLFVGIPGGFYFDLWHSVGLNDSDFSSNWGDELDFTVGWSGALDKVHRFLKGVDLDIGVSYFDIVELVKFSGEDFVQPYGEVRKHFPLSESHSLVPYLRTELPFSLDESDQNGAYLYAGVGHDWQITPRLVFSHRISALYDNGAYGLEEGIIGNYTAGFSLQLSKRTNLDLGLLKITAPLAGAGERKTEFTYGGGIGISFGF